MRTSFSIVTFVKESELSLTIQYLNQRSNISNRHVRELMGLIAAEELGHMEIISVAINKLGGPPLTCADAQGTSWNISYIDQCADTVKMLEMDVQAENRAQRLYRRHLELTSDSYMKKMVNFLISREQVHMSLLQKAQILIREGGSIEDFIGLIYEYKMSLQVLE